MLILNCEIDSQSYLLLEEAAWMMKEDERGVWTLARDSWAGA